MLKARHAVRTHYTLITKANMLLMCVKESLGFMLFLCGGYRGIHSLSFDFSLVLELAVPQGYTHTHTHTHTHIETM